MLALLGASLTQLELSYQYSLTLIGFLIALNNIVIGSLQIPLGHLADHFNKEKLILISGIATASLILILPVIKNLFGIAIVLVFLGFTIAVYLASSTALSAILGKEAGMGKTMGALNSAFSAGTIAGYILLGYITYYWGIRCTFSITGIIFLINSILIYFLWIGNKYKKTRSDY